MGTLLKSAQLANQAGQVRPLYSIPAETSAAPATPAPFPPGAHGGATDGGAALEQHVRLLSRIISESVAARERLLMDLRPELLNLVLALVREIVGHETSVDSSVIENTLTQSLKQLHFATRTTIWLHPDDLAHLQERPDVVAGLPGSIEMVGDATIERGGCRLESDRGGIDATVSTQLQSLAEGLGQQFAGAPATAGGGNDDRLG